MNWITNNNYTIKRKFNQINNKGNNNKLIKAFNEMGKPEKTMMNKNKINYNINCVNQDNNNNNNYTDMYYQINSTEALEEQLKKEENIVKSNLNSKYILSELIAI